MRFDRIIADALTQLHTARDPLPPGARAIVDYWEAATEALIRAGIAPDRAERLAYEGVVLGLSNKGHYPQAIIIEE